MTFRYSIDAITSDGHVEGWARGTDKRRPSGIEIRHNGDVLLACIADRFRRDLLKEPDSHGFHGFRGRLRRVLPPERYDVVVSNPLAPIVTEGRPDTLHIAAPLQVSSDIRIADLLVTESMWTDADVVSHLAVLKLDANMRTMGIRRFVDTCFYFSLGRWGDDAGLDRYQQALFTGELTPVEFVRILLTSDERKQNSKTPLPGPYSYKFPFDLSL